HLVVQPGVDPGRAPISGAFAASPASASTSAIIAPMAGGGFGALSGAAGTNLAQVVTSNIGDQLATALASGQPFFNTVEPSPTMGAGSTFPVAVSLSATGDQINTAVRAGGAN